MVDRGPRGEGGGGARAAAAAAAARAPSERQLAAVEAALGGPLARIANRVAGTDPRAIWMGPADWLVLGARLDERLGQAIAAACEGTAHHAADVSAAHALHRVEGPARAT
ncbi:MAG: hypothetical protein WDN24_12285 [Sphingomonas sp.]